MALQFSKYEGLGNDFLLLDGGLLASIGADEAHALCDRHFGIGADGVLFVGLAEGRPFMRVINADGSRPEMCGNGLRCAALYLAHQGVVEGTSFVVETDAGPHVCTLSGKGIEAQVAVRMPPASLEASAVLAGASGRVVEQPFEAQGHTLHGTAVSMGNPHFVFFDVARELQDPLGPALTVDPRFPSGANISFARMTAPGVMALRVHERGAGWTLACGTGACAAVVAAVETGRASRGEAVEVHLPGGPLHIVVADPEEPISMTGAVRHVFDGTFAGVLGARS